MLHSLWSSIEPLLLQVERPSRYINHEPGSIYKPNSSFNVCMMYPDTYEIGQANQALRILINRINECDDMAAERGFLPGIDMCDILREHKLPLFSIESSAALNSFDVVGITLPHELAATNILEMLDLGHIPLHASNRTQSDPFVVAGGPCAYNPEPYAPFFDAFNIGEGEESLPLGLRIIKEGKEAGRSREEILANLATLEGWYVPSLYEVVKEREAQEGGYWVRPLQENVPQVIEKQIYRDFSTSPAWERCIIPFASVVHDRLNVEILRGCARGCRFCQAGMMYRPVRERASQNICEGIEKGLQESGYDEVSLTSLSSTDHSEIKEILHTLNDAYTGKAVRMSIPSQRLDSFGVTMAGLVAGQKKGGLTFAPEAGTQRLRDVINKNVCEDDLFSATEAAFKAGWRRVKLYFMIGLPTETDDDIKGIARLVQQVYDKACKVIPKAQKGSIQISVSVAVFVPKAQTPFQWDGQIPREEALRRITLLRNSIKYRAISLSWHDPYTSFLEAIVSRSGREGAQLIEEAWKRGARFDAWSEIFNKQAWEDAASFLGIDCEAIAQKTYDTSYVLPWSHISCGIEASWFALERARADEGILTPDCTYDQCSQCGVCMRYGITNHIAGERHDGSK